MKTGSKGFTLVELMVVVVIIGILIAIAIPVYSIIVNRAERAAVEANLRTLDGAIMLYYASKGFYPVDNSAADGEEWIIENPKWKHYNALAPYVEPFETVGGERYVIYGAASAPSGVSISTNRAFIVLGDGVTVGGYKAVRENESYYLVNLPWKKEEQAKGYVVQLADFQDADSNYWDPSILPHWQANQLGFGGYQYTGTSKNVIIPKAIGTIVLKRIGIDVFNDKGLNSVVFDEDSDIEWIDARAFRNNNLTEIALPESLTRIQDRAFLNNNLTSVVIPNKVTNIGNEAFSRLGDGNHDKNNITTITIGAGVTIGHHAFRGNNAFKEAYEAAGGGAGTYELVDGQWEKQDP